MNNTLESSKFFPIIAWTTVVGFALFTYMLTTHIQSELDGIGDGVDRLEQRLDEMDAKKIAQ